MDVNPITDPEDDTGRESALTPKAAVKRGNPAAASGRRPLQPPRTGWSPRGAGRSTASGASFTAHTHPTTPVVPRPAAEAGAPVNGHAEKRMERLVRPSAARGQSFGGPP